MAIIGDISNSFKFIDFKKNLKLGLSAIGKQYIVSALSRNILTCLYSNTTSTHFQLDPPTVQDYWPTGTIVYQMEISEPMPSQTKYNRLFKQLIQDFRFYFFIQVHCSCLVSLQSVKMKF